MGLGSLQQEKLRHLLIAYGDKEGDRLIAQRCAALPEDPFSVSHVTVNRYRHTVKAMIEAIQLFNKGTAGLKLNQKLQDRLDKDADVLRKALFSRLVQVLKDDPPKPPEGKKGKNGMAKYAETLDAWQRKHDAELIMISRECSGNVRLRADISRTLVQFSSYIDARDQRDQSIGKGSAVTLQEVQANILPFLCDDCKDRLLTREKAPGAAVEVEAREVD